MTNDEIFAQAVAFTFRNEGLWSDTPGDRGGKTKFGVTLATLQNLGSLGDFNGDGKTNAEDLVMMSKSQAADIYRKNYWVWDRPEFDQVNPVVKAKHFDTAVNCGVRRANLILQKACGAKADGILGQKTIGFVTHADVNDLLTDFCREQKKFYQLIIDKRPDQKKFEHNWFHRAQLIPIIIPE